MTDAPPVPVEVNCPVTKGTFWPMMIRASSLSIVSRLGVARTLALVSLSSARASSGRFSTAPSMPEWSWCRAPPQVQARAGRRDVLRRGQDAPAARQVREVGAAYAAGRPVLDVEQLPLDAELGRLLGGDLDDQRFDVDLGAAHVELVDDGAQIAIDRVRRRDDQRVGGRIGGNHRAPGRHGDR
ncbi:MAG: hypothetical protein R3E68_12655 [Burkholderiaceae bacterium]